MKTVKSEKEKKRIRSMVEKIGGKPWEKGYKKIARVTEDSASVAAKTEDTFATLGDSLSIARKADRGSYIKVVPFDDTFDDTVCASIRPAYEEIEDIYHQWFPEDGDAPLTEEVFKELPKRIIASALETIVASEITEMILSLTTTKRRVHDIPFLSYFKKQATELVKRFSLNSASICKLALGELKRNFHLPRNNSYYSLLNYLFGVDPNVPSIDEFVQAKHPDWFIYKADSSSASDSSKKIPPYSLDDTWFVLNPKEGRTIMMTGREIVVGISKGTFSEEEIFKSLPGTVQSFIKEELRKYELFTRSKTLYADWYLEDEGIPLSSSDRLAMDEMLKILKGGMASRLEVEPEAGTREIPDSVPYSPIPPEGCYSVVDPATGEKKYMTKEQLKNLFKESRDAFMKTRASRSEDKD